MEQKSISSKELMLFIISTLAFIVGMIALVVYQINALWIWCLYVAVWFWVEIRIAKNIQLSPLHWVLIIIGICVLDIVLVALLS